MAPHILPEGDRMLVVDEVLVRGVLSRFLTRRGFEIVEAENGERALRLLSDPRLDVDLVLTDLDMPKINGYEVIRVLRLHRPDLPVVAMSNTYTASRDQSGSGVTDLTPGVPLLPKPLDLSLLVRTIDDCIADARERRQEAQIGRARAVRAREAAHATRAWSTAIKQRQIDLVSAALEIRSTPKT